MMPAMSVEKTQITFDLCGLRCPQPVLRAKKAIRNLPIGSVIVFECTDPLTVIDIPHLVHQTGHRLEVTEQNGQPLCVPYSQATLVDRKAD